MWFPCNVTGALSVGCFCEKIDPELVPETELLRHSSKVLLGKAHSNHFGLVLLNLSLCRPFTIVCPDANIAVTVMFRASK